MGTRIVKAESLSYREGKDQVVFQGGYNPFPGAYKFTHWECATGSLPTQDILCCYDPTVRKGKSYITCM